VYGRCRAIFADETDAVARANDEGDVVKKIISAKMYGEMRDCEHVIFKKKFKPD